MGIQKYLDASTCYITEEDDKKIKHPEFPYSVIEYDFGYFIFCGAHHEEMEEELADFGMSYAFIKLMLYANREDCWYLRLDCDGDNTLPFRKFEW